MTFKDLRERLKQLLRDSAYEDNDSLKTLADSAMLDICFRCVPTLLVSSDLRKYEVLRFIDNERFIRKPAPINGDSSIIELDTSLQSALLYRLASQLAKAEKANYYDKCYRVELDRYTYSHFKSTESEY